MERDGTMKSLPERTWRMPRLRRSSRLPSWLWARREGLVSIPALPETVAAYLAERAANRLSSASLRMDRAAMRYHALMLATRISPTTRSCAGCCAVILAEPHVTAVPQETCRSHSLEPRCDLAECPANTHRRGQHIPSLRSSGVGGAIQVRDRANSYQTMLRGAKALLGTRDRRPHTRYSGPPVTAMRDQFSFDMLPLVRLDTYLHHLGEPLGTRLSASISLASAR